MMSKKMACPHCGRVITITEPRPCMYCGMDITQEQMEQARKIDEDKDVSKDVSERLEKLSEHSAVHEPASKSRIWLNAIGKFLFNKPYGLALLFIALIVLVGFVFISGRKTESQIGEKISAKKMRQELTQMAMETKGRASSNKGFGAMSLPQKKELVRPLREMILAYAKFHGSLPTSLDPDASQLKPYGDVEKALEPFKDGHIKEYTLEKYGSNARIARITVQDDFDNEISFSVTRPK